MTDPIEDRMREIADAVGDGVPVDWDRERVRSPDLSDTLEGLRLIESIASVHRPPDGADDMGTRADDPVDPVRTVAIDLALGQTPFQWGELRVLEKLGEGSFAEVYRAWDPGLAREVALKLIRPSANAAGDSARRWLEEARRLARVRHPNVILVHSASVHEGRAGITTELLHGQTLEEWLTAHGSMSAREAALAGMDLCSALAAVHAAGLVHGDVKAANALREIEGTTDAGAATGSAGRIVLLDFGAAGARTTTIASGNTGADRTQSERGAPAPDEFEWIGTVFATPLVSAPEVLRGEPPTPAADLYSLGVLLYRLVTARYPVEAATLPELRARLERGERDSLREARPDLPHAFIQAVERALEPDPARRFTGAAEMERALAVVLGGAPRGSRARPAALLSLLALGALAAAIAIVAVIRSRPGESIAHRSMPAPVTPAARSDSGSTPPSARVSVSTANAALGALLPIDADLIRSAGGGRETMSDRSRVAPGDHLFMEVESGEPVYVYVLDEDRAGVTAVLFPVPGTDLTNPLGAGRVHRLPGNRNGRPLDWQVTSAGGIETFLIIASRARLPEIDSRLADLPRAAEGQPVSYAELPSSSLDQLRGVTGLADAGGKNVEGGRLADLARRLSAGAPPGLWTRLLRVENSGR